MDVSLSSPPAAQQQPSMPVPAHAPEPAPEPAPVALGKRPPMIPKLDIAAVDARRADDNARIPAEEEVPMSARVHRIAGGDRSSTADTTQSRAMNATLASQRLGHYTERTAHNVSEIIGALQDFMWRHRREMRGIVPTDTFDTSAAGAAAGAADASAADASAAVFQEYKWIEDLLRGNSQLDAWSKRLPLHWSVNAFYMRNRNFAHYVPNTTAVTHTTDNDDVRNNSRYVHSVIGSEFLSRAEFAQLLALHPSVRKEDGVTMDTSGKLTDAQTRCIEQHPFIGPLVVQEPLQHQLFDLLDLYDVWLWVCLAFLAV
jgi:hypothetical protein